MKEIKKLNIICLIIVLINVLFCDLITGIASANELTRESDNEALIQVTSKNQSESEIQWHISVNPLKQDLESKKLTLSLEGNHDLNLSLLKNQLISYGIEVTQPDTSQSDYILELKDNNQSLETDITTLISDQNKTDYRLKLSMLVNGNVVNASDGVYQTFPIKGNVTFENLPTSLQHPASEVKLVNSETKEIVMTESVDSDGTYIINDVRKFDEFGNEIKYEIESSLKGNYKTEINHYDITHTYLETTIKGNVTNPSNESLELTLVNQQTNEVLKTKAIDSEETSYQFEDLPVNDEEGTPIKYGIKVAEVKDYRTEVKDYNIVLTREDSDTTTEEATTEEATTEEATTEEATTEEVTTEEATTEETTTEEVTTEEATTEEVTTEEATTENVTTEDISSTNSVVIESEPIQPTSRLGLRSFSLSSANIQTLAASSGTTFTTNTPIKHSTTGDTMTMNATLSPDGTKINWTITIGRNGNTAHSIQYNLYNMVFSAGQTLDTTSIKQTLNYGTTSTTKSLTYNSTYKSITGAFSGYGYPTTGGYGPNAAVISFSTTITDKTLTSYDLSIGGGSVPAQFIANNVANTILINGKITTSDNIPPEAPKVNAVTTTTLNVTGTAEPASTVTVLLPNGTKVTGTADGTGKYTIPIPPQSEGSVITVNATDRSGNVSPNTQITVSDMATTTIGTVYDNQTSIIGTAAPNSIVTITNAAGSVLGTTKADENGSYYVELFRAQSAGTVIYAVSKNASGQVSNKAQTTVLSSAGVPTPGNGLPIVEPSPTFNGDIDDMVWDERGLYRNRVPQAVKYDEGFLWKAAQPTSKSNQYAIDLKTQGRDTVSTLPLDIVLVVDNSKSMGTVNSNGITRWQNMKNSVNEFIDNVTASNSGSANDTRIGVVNFGSTIISQTSFQSSATSIKSAIPTSYQTNNALNSGTGHTFTQLGIRTGSQMLETARPTAKKVMVVLTDGAPTFSYKGTVATSPENITAFDYGTRVGDGGVYPLNSAFGNYAYSIGNVAITNHGQPTISEAKLIKAAHPDYEIFSIGLDTNVMSGLDSATPTEMNNVINNIASKQSNAFVTTDTAKDLPNILANISQTTIKSMEKATITDPIGEMFDLDMGVDNILNPEDYTLTASNPALLTNVTPVYDPVTRTIKLTGITLGKGEWINFNYKVTLRTNDPSFVDGQYYPMNGETTLQPTSTSTTTIEYPVPEAKYSQPTYSFTFNKVGNDQAPLSGAVFTLTNSKGNILTTTSTENGIVQFTGLVPGNYSLKEITAPQGYLLDSTTHAVNISSNGVLTVDGIAYTGSSWFELINEKALGNIEVRKFEEGNTAKLLAGATFELRDTTGKVIMTKTTDSSGIIKFIDLPYGSYVLVETQAPKGYALDSKPIPISINSNTTINKDVANSKQLLPNTGGMGTILFTVLGICLILLAILLKRKRK